MTKPQQKQDDENKNEEAKKPGQDVTVYEFGDDAGAGMEDVRREEYKIPFLAVLDPKSAQCKPPAAGGVPGAKGGTLYNTATGEIFDGERGVFFVPVKRDENYPERISRTTDGTSGGGFVGIRAPNDPLVLRLRKEQGQFGRLKVPSQDGGEWQAGVDHELVQTFYLYGLAFPDDKDINPSPVLIAFKSTQIKKYQGFITRQQSIQYPTAKGMVKPPLWAHVWRLRTAYESKGEQRSWYGWVIGLREEPSRKSLLQMNDPLYVAGKDLYTSITAGTKAADYAAQESTATTESEEIPM